VGGRVARPGLASRARADLRRFALALPGAHEDFPWGESVVKVGKKVFLFLGRGGGGLSLSVKLPSSNLIALDLPFASPTAYGLARGGWVTARFEAHERPPRELLRQWVVESYRAVAPRRRVGELEARSVGGSEGER
jgi:predicted DNA-binding protein (MmcQ/YjbR family)